MMKALGMILAMGGWGFHVEVRRLHRDQAPLFVPSQPLDGPMVSLGKAVPRFVITPGTTFQQVQDQFFDANRADISVWFPRVLGYHFLGGVPPPAGPPCPFRLFYKGYELAPTTQILLDDETPNPEATAVWPPGATVAIEPTAGVIVFTVGLLDDNERPAFDVTILTEFDTHPVEERRSWRDWESMSDHRAKLRYQQKIVSPAPMQFLAWRGLRMNNIGLAVMRQVRRAPELAHIEDWSDVGFEIRLVRPRYYSTQYYGTQYYGRPQNRKEFWGPRDRLNHDIIDFEDTAQTLSSLPAGGPGGLARLSLATALGNTYLSPLHFLVRMTYGSSQGMPWQVRSYSDEEEMLLSRFCHEPDPTTSNCGLEDVRPATWSVANMEARHLQLTGSLPAPPASTSSNQKLECRLL